MNIFTTADLSRALLPTTFTMSPTGLESLPLLPLERICEYLANIELDRDSLFAFSLASKSCCIAANRQRFQRIHLRIDDSTKLEADLAKWNLVLGHRGRELVRKLKVSGIMPLDPVPDRSEPDAHDLKWERFVLEHERESKENDYDRFASDWFLEQPSIPVSYLIHNEEKDEKRVRNEMWKPLAQFVTELPGLTDMVWYCENGLPVCIMEVINGSGIRLRMHTTISFGRDGRDGKIPKAIDLDEYQIATSSNLTHISVSYSRSTRFETSSNNSGFDYLDFGPEMVQQMVAQSAPNLTSVHLNWSHSTLFGPNLKFCCAPYPPPGFSVKIGPKRKVTSSGHDDSITKGHLKVLDIQGSKPLCTACFSQWHRHTHFQDLQRMNICLEPGSLQLMVQLAQADSFHSLRDLSLEVHSLDHDNMNSDLCSLFAALYPLAFLMLKEISDLDVWRTVLQRHGGTLRRLITRTSLSREYIEIMPQYCSSLERLEFELHRSGGDRYEVDCYKALGMLPRLESLILHLDCWVWDPNPPITVQTRHGIYTDEERLHFIRLATINSAVDADLARSIFKLISDTQATVSDAPRRPFSRLRLRVSPALRIGEELAHDFSKIGVALGRSWVCTRDARDTHEDDFHIHETNKSMRKRKDCSYLLDEPLADSAIGHLYERIWKEFWPEETGYWVDSWRSFPLARYVESLFLFSIHD